MNDLSNIRIASHGSPTNGLDMIGAVDAMRKRLLSRVDLADADYASLVENKLELEALDRFGAQLKGASDLESVSWLIRRVAQLEARVNALTLTLGRWEADREPPQPEPQRHVVKMDQSVVQEGFHYVERMQGDVCFRWIGPAPKARVYLPKIRMPLELTLVVASSYKGVQPEAARVAFNDGPWTPVTAERVEGSTVLRCRPPSGPSRDGLVHFVDIDCGATFRPADDGASDVRKIGLALSRIEMVSL
jgi:hypothetical protein